MPLVVSQGVQLGEKCGREAMQFFFNRKQMYQNQPLMLLPGAALPTFTVLISLGVKTALSLRAVSNVLVTLRLAWRYPTLWVSNFLFSKSMARPCHLNAFLCPAPASFCSSYLHLN